MNQHTHTPNDPKNADTDAMTAAMMATTEDADQATLDRLMRHTRNVSAKPAKRGLHWGWMALPMAVAGAAAAVALTTSPSGPGLENTGVPVAVVEPSGEALETEIASVLDERADTSGAEDLGPFESIASFDPAAQEGDWVSPGFETDDSEELEDWIEAYELVLAEG